FNTRTTQLAAPVTFVDVHRPESAVGAEFQYLFRSQYVNLTSGVGFFDIDGRINTSIGTTIPTPRGPLSRVTLSTRSTALRHTNVYTYSYINPLRNVTVTLGVSGDFTDGSSPDVGGIDNINPKFGLTWNPFPDTTLRVAAFRVLKRTLITNQTLEPTQVAG